MALAEDLLMSGVNFLLGNNLASGKVWVQLMSADGDQDVVAAEVADYVNSVITRPKARQANRRRVIVGSDSRGTAITQGHHKRSAVFVLMPQ